MRCRRCFLLVSFVALTMAIAWATPAMEAREDDAIRVLSFNIRYGTAPDRENAWPARRELVFQVLRNTQWDFVGLQEALRFQLDEIQAATGGLGVIGVGRDDGEQAGEYSAILYRRDRWFAQQSGTFWLSDRPDIPGSKSWGNEIPRIVTWARFVERNSGRAVWVFNTHFDHRSQPSREKSARLLAQEIARQCHNEPVIVTGDFNAGEDNPAIRYLVGPQSDSPVRLRDTFRLLHPDAAQVGTFHGFTGRTDGAKIDYVLVGEHGEVLQAEIIRVANDGRYPSDHFPVMAVVRFVRQAAEERAPGAVRSGWHLPRIEGARPRNVVFILTDDHRWDAFGFMGHPFLRTPHLDRLAQNGIVCRNAFVTTSLCSPSRASILTGQYAHRHRVINNYFPVPAGTIFFPQYLQAAGYQTAFIGKWHMGHESDEPQPGFDHWVSFRGQGNYYPPNPGYTLNVDGRRVPQRGYITDELTEYAIRWLEKRDRRRPFFLYLSHKAAHGPYQPAERHRGQYAGKQLPLPPTFSDTPEQRANKPRWVIDQRNSWHGVDYPYHGRLGTLEELYRQYCETLLAVDESVGRLMDFLKDEGLWDSTLVIYMGDNGHGWGEHGLIDKRTAYEWSMRVPLILHCPELFRPGGELQQLVANIDIAPTILEAAGLKAPASMDGMSFLSLARGQHVMWREMLLYEYFWERNYPQTPTIHAVKTDRYKYIHYYGIWDRDELYDVANDPHETRNLIDDPEHRHVAAQLNQKLFDLLEATGGMSIPLYRDAGTVQNRRRLEGAKPADFPAEFYQP